MKLAYPRLQVGAFAERIAQTVQEAIPQVFGFGLLLAPHPLGFLVGEALLEPQRLCLAQGPRANRNVLYQCPVQACLGEYILVFFSPMAGVFRLLGRRLHRQIGRFDRVAGNGLNCLTLGFEILTVSHAKLLSVDGFAATGLVMSGRSRA